MASSDNDHSGTRVAAYCGQAIADETLEMLTHEYLANTELLAESGGGNIYGFVLGNRAMVYKHVLDPRALSNLADCYQRWGRVHPQSDWAVPLLLVYHARNALTGYIMPHADGQTLHSIPPDELNLPLLVGRVALAMQRALAAGISPLVEHGGNVVVAKGASGLFDTPMLIDADGCPSSAGSEHDLFIIEQLPVIFSNMEANGDHRRVFAERRGRVELLHPHKCVNDLLKQMATMSRKFEEWWNEPARQREPPRRGLPMPGARPPVDDVIECIDSADEQGHDADAHAPEHADRAPLGQPVKIDPDTEAVTPRQTIRTPDIISLAFSDEECGENPVEPSEASAAGDDSTGSLLQEFLEERAQAHDDWRGFIQSMPARRAIIRKYTGKPPVDEDVKKWQVNMEQASRNDRPDSGWEIHTPARFQARM